MILLSNILKNIGVQDCPHALDFRRYTTVHERDRLRDMARRVDRAHEETNTRLNIEKAVNRCYEIFDHLFAASDIGLQNAFKEYIETERLYLISKHGPDAYHMPNMVEPAKQKRFNIKRYSLKIQRKYARFDESTRERYREALRAKRRTRLPKFEQFDVLRTMKASYALKLKDLHYTKPKDDRQTWFGVEIECFLPTKARGPRAEIFQNLIDEIRRSMGGTYLNRPMIEPYFLQGVGFIRDGSLNNVPEGFFAVEFTVATSRESGYVNLKKLCKVLNELKARVNAKCGLHVHLDMRSEFQALGSITEMNRLYADRFEKSLDLIQAAIHPLRRNTSYARARVDTEKYSAVHLAASDKRKTIEIRCHSGTTNFDKIVNWCEFLLACKNYSGEKKLTKSADLLRLEMPREARLYIADRMSHFSKPLKEIERKRGAKIKANYLGNVALTSKILDARNAGAAETVALWAALGMPKSYDFETVIHEITGCSRDVASALKRDIFDRVIHEQDEIDAREIAFKAALYRHVQSFTRPEQCHISAAGWITSLHELSSSNIMYFSNELYSWYKRVLEKREDELQLSLYKSFEVSKIDFSEFTKVVGV